MSEPKDEEEAALRRARAERLRRRIDTPETGATEPEEAPESPHDFIQRRMRELDGEKED